MDRTRRAVSTRKAPALTVPPQRADATQAMTALTGNGRQTDKSVERLTLSRTLERDTRMNPNSNSQQIQDMADRAGAAVSKKDRAISAFVPVYNAVVASLKTAITEETYTAFMKFHKAFPKAAPWRNILGVEAEDKTPATLKAIKAAKNLSDYVRFKSPIALAHGTRRKAGKGGSKGRSWAGLVKYFEAVSGSDVAGADLDVAAKFVAAVVTWGQKLTLPAAA